MNIEKIKQLVNKYLEGETTLREEQMLFEYFRDEEIPEELKSYTETFKYFENRRQDTVGEDFNPLAKIEAEKSNITNQSVNNYRFTNLTLIWSLRIAAGLILLLIGFSAGQFLNQSPAVSNKEVAALHQEVQQMKEALMYGGSYQQVSAGERLSAVNLSTKIPTDSKNLDNEITDILVHTMNNDKSVNVRMAAAEALFRFRGERRIRLALINSLTEQEDPQMQITLIDMLVQMKAKGAVNEMNKMLMNTDTRDIVKQQLKAGIAELQT